MNYSNTVSFMCVAKINLNFKEAGTLESKSSPLVPCAQILNNKSKNGKMENDVNKSYFLHRYQSFGSDSKYTRKNK